MKKQKIYNRIWMVVILSIFILAASKCHSQPAKHKVYVGLSQDFKMGYEGPHGDGGTFNLEATLGFEWNNMKVWTAYEWLKQINYFKYTYIAADFKLIKLFDSAVVMSLGPEFSVLYRTRDNPDYTSTTAYRNQDAFFSYGINATTDWWFTRTTALTLNANAFRAEPYDDFGNTIDEDFRWDVRLGLIIVLHSN